ncbi:MAG: hypothetical protein LUG84_03820, partial [Akkermansiaceae bacterium]|nr:hypothetical protein [Akkermansiaceae bacterium]
MSPVADAVAVTSASSPESERSPVEAPSSVALAAPVTSPTEPSVTARAPDMATEPMMSESVTVTSAAPVTSPETVEPLLTETVPAPESARPPVEAPSSVALAAPVTSPTEPSVTARAPDMATEPMMSESVTVTSAAPVTSPETVEPLLTETVPA